MPSFVSRNFGLVLQSEADIVEPFSYVQQNGTTQTLPDSLVKTLRALLLRADKAVSLQVNGQPLTVLLQPGGLCLLMDVAQLGDQGGALNTVTNASGEAAEVQGVVLGQGT